MSLGLRDSRDRRRRKFRRAVFKWVLALALIVSAGVFAYETGSRLAERETIRLKEQIAELSKTIEESRQDDSALKAAAEAAEQGQREWQQRYEKDVPSGADKQLYDLARQKLADGVDLERLEFVIRATRNERLCAEGLATRRFIVPTPLYKGANDSVGFAKATITVTAKGQSSRDSSGNPLARFDPAVVLRKLTKIRSKSLLSRTLVVLQFSITVFLITATLIMHRQLNFMKEKNLGYDRERIVQIPLASQESEAEQTFKLYKIELERDNRVIGVAAAMNPFGLEWATLGYTDEFGNEIRFVYNQVTYNFVETMGMEIVEGRDFSEEYATDYHDAMIVNKAFLRRLGWQTGIDQTLPEKFNRDMRIVGVVSDFHIGSLHEEIRPLALTLSRIPLSKIEYGRGIGNSVSLSSVIIRIAAGETQPVLDFLRAKWQRVAVNQPFDHEFLDRTIDAQYRQEQRWGEIINYSSVLAITIACLGLFSLVSLSLERRVKEIGIRKVLGASVRGIVTKLSKDFVKLVLVANVIAWPVAWYVMNRWLQDFAYRIDISWWVFTLAAGLALAIALLTVSTQAIRAALANPIEALKYE